MRAQMLIEQHRIYNLIESSDENPRELFYYSINFAINYHVRDFGLDKP